MKNTKRIFSVLLVMLMLLSSAPLGGFIGPKASAASYKGTCGKNAYWSFNNETGVLEITGSGEMYDYDYYNDYAPWYSYNDSIKTVTIESEVTSIGEYAFYECSKLESIIIPESVTSIGGSAFEYCDSLESVTIPDSVTSIGDSAFGSCYSLEKIKIPNSVTIIGDSAFFCCYSLESITIPDSVTSIGDKAFWGCDSLESVTIPNSVTSIGDDAFYSCDSLQSITVDDNSNYYSSDTYGVLYNKDKTTLIQYPIGNTRTSFDIPNSVTSIGDWAFGWCDKLSRVEIGSGVTSIGRYAFFDCDSLEKIIISNSVTSIGDDAFGGCDSLESVKIPESVTSIGDDAFEDCESLERVTIPNSVTNIGAGAFRSCESLENITIPDSVTSIGYEAFIYCYGLESITVDDNNDYYSSDSYGVLYNKDKTTLVQYPIGNTRTSFDIPDSVTSIGKQAFNFCNKLLSVEIGNSVTTIGRYAFCYCESLESITIPDSVTSIGNWAFAYCDSLKDVYYAGSEIDWNKILIGSGNSFLTSANLTCLKKDPDLSQPTTPSDKYDEWDKLSSDTATFQKAHYNFAETYALSFLKYNRSFYTNVWSAENGKRIIPSLVWKVVGDIGEVMQFKFNDLTINANYYDLFVSDLVLAMNNVDRTSKFSVGLAKNYNKYFGSIMKLFKSTKEWEEATANGIVLDVEVEGFLTKPGYEIPKNLESVLSKIFKNVFTNHQKGFTNIFKLANSANQMLDYVSKGADIINAFKKAYDTYVIVETFKDMESEFYDMCNLVAAEMEKENVGLANAFLSSVYKYKNAAADDKALFDSLLTLNIDTLNVAYDLTMKDVFKNLSYTLIAKMLNCSTASLNIISTTYNLTYHVLNGLTKNGTKSNYYTLMYYAAPVEKALMTVVNNNAKIFTTNYLYNQNESYQSAKNFDISYNMWRCTNMYLYECAYNFLAAQKIQDEMKLAKQYKDSWNNIKCHNGLTDVTSSKLVTVSCPVDIYVYDTDMNIVLSVENEIPTYCDDKISLSIANGVKMFSYPANEEYIIDIKARESGEMDYNITEIQDDSVTRIIEFYGIELIKDQVYSGSIPYELNLDNSEYKLITGKNQIFCDYDSLDNVCESGKHQFGSWSYVTTPNIGELDYEERVCSVCGKHEKKTVHNEHTDLLVGNYVEATCTSEGYSGDTYCALCGEIIQTGNVTPKAEHKFSKEEKLPTCTQEGHKTYTCSVCQYNYTEPIPATGHTDKNRDNKCDFCGASLGEAPTDPSTACNHICHKTGFMGFIYKIIRIFWKLFRTNQYCTCGARHW